MTRGPARGRVVALAVLVLAAGCVYYPYIGDVGGVALRPVKGRAVVHEGRAVFYMEIASSGKHGDVLTGASAPIARQTQLVAASGDTVERLEIPGASVVRFEKGGPRIVFSELTRPVTPGEVFIVTLQFEKSGLIGVITVAE